MSEAVSALAGHRFSGAIDVEDLGVRGMITVRGDLASKEIAAGLKSAVNLDVPKPSSVTSGGDITCLWMSPDELLLELPYADVADVFGALDASLENAHSLVVDVSHARSCFRLTGGEAVLRDTLAKLTPADLRRQALPVGQVRRTRLAQVPAAFWFVSDRDIRLICFRSVSDYVFGVLEKSAMLGSEPQYF